MPSPGRCCKFGEKGNLICKPGGNCGGLNSCKKREEIEIFIEQCFQYGTYYSCTVLFGG
jgi:hypothetical protein